MIEEFAKKNKSPKKLNEVKTFPIPFFCEDVKENLIFNTNTSSKASKEKILNQALKLHSEGNISQAAKNYQSFIEQGFLDHRAFSNYGAILKDLGKLQKAETYFRKAIKIKPDFAEAHSNLGNLLRDNGDLQEAENSFRKAIDIKPTFSEAHYNLANILRDNGKLNDAEMFMRKSIKIKNDFAASHCNLGLILIQLGKLKEAEISIRKAIEIKPDYAIAHSNLGYLLEKDFRVEESIESFRKAYFYDPDNPKLYALKGIKPFLISRQPLIENKRFINTLNINSWQKSKIILKEICKINPKYIQDNVDEFISIWCDICIELVNNRDLKGLVSILIELIIIGERKLSFDKFVLFLFENISLELLLLETIYSKDKLLIKLIYSEYLYRIGNILAAESFAAQNLNNSVDLIKNNEDENITWMIIRRSLILFNNKNLAKRDLLKVIKQLTN